MMSAEGNSPYEMALQSPESEGNSYSQLSPLESVYEIVGKAANAESEHQYIELSQIEEVYATGIKSTELKEPSYNEVSQAEVTYDTVHEVRPTIYTSHFFSVVNNT